ncbi:MAG: glycosyltransferase family 2 protein [Opitutales bacterium]|nr:glycosyltransferase family 2 protein [Opitutales bacterium]
MVKISVIVPIYNVEAFLRECLDSVVAQSFDGFEVLAIDDGSPDDSGKIADEYAEKYPQIKVFHKQNGGYASACNFGLEHARGEYISVIEPDDYIDQGMFADLYARAEKTNADIVKSRYFEFLHLPKIRRREKICGAGIEEDAAFTLAEHPELLRFHPSIWTCLYKTSFLRENKIEFQTNPFRTWEDNLFQIQTLYSARRIAYANKAYYHWRVATLLHYQKLKSPHVPEAIISQTHNWLESAGCKNPDIFANLFHREMGYFKFAYRMAMPADFKRLAAASTDYFRRISGLNIEKSPYYKPKAKFKLLKNAPLVFFVSEKIKFAFSRIFKSIKVRVR